MKRKAITYAKSAKVQMEKHMAPKRKMKSVCLGPTSCSSAISALFCANERRAVGSVDAGTIKSDGRDMPRTIETRRSPGGRAVPLAAAGPLAAAEATVRRRRGGCAVVAEGEDDADGEETEEAEDAGA